MYFVVIKQFARTLKQLDHVLAKAEAYAQARKFDVNNFMTARLAPDMLPFPAQVRIACDSAKAAAAYIAGKDAPKHEDDEKTIAELRARIGKCVAYLETFTEQDFAAIGPTTLVKLPNRPGKAIAAEEYLLARQVPNVYFHVTCAYAILRHGGVDVGKTDYLGPLGFVDV